jgi:hypothetical protein
MLGGTLFEKEKCRGFLVFGYKLVSLCVSLLFMTEARAVICVDDIAARDQDKR